MTTQVTSPGSPFSGDQLEEEQTRIFSRVVVDPGPARGEPTGHRYVAVAIPALQELDLEASEVGWTAVVGAALWGFGISVIGAAGFLALSGH